MHFLPDVYVPCDVCHGKRYNRETLEIHYKGYTRFPARPRHDRRGRPAIFRLEPRARARAQARDASWTSACRTSSSARSATTLSGGEAQRVKLSRELAAACPGPCALRASSTRRPRAWPALSTTSNSCSGSPTACAMAGNTVVVIEHNLDVIKGRRRRVIDLGPERSGRNGGEVIAVGTPPGQIAKERSLFFQPFPRARARQRQEERRGMSAASGGNVGRDATRLAEVVADPRCAGATSTRSATSAIRHS